MEGDTGKKCNDKTYLVAIGIACFRVISLSFSQLL